MTRAPRCSPAARAWSRCCRCGSPRRPRWSTSTASRASTRSRSTTPASGSARWPGTRTCSPPRTYAGCSRWSRWRWPTSRTPRSATAAPPSARWCTRTPRPRCRSCCPCSAARSRSRDRAVAARSRPPSSTSARWSRSVRHDEVAVSAFFPALAPGAGRGVRRDRPPARRLRAGRRGRAGRGRLRCRSATSRSPTSRRSSTCPGVADDDLGEAALAHLEPGDDIHATAAYRAQLVRVLTARVVRSARTHATGGR